MTGFNTTPYTRVESSWGELVVATLLSSRVALGIPGLTLPLASLGCDNLVRFKFSAVGGVVVEGLTM